MKDKRYSIIYSSKTGNTKKLAETIYNTLSQDECDYYGTLDNIGNELSKTISAYTKDSNFVKSFISTAEAAKWCFEQNKCSSLNSGVRSHIGEVAKGKRKTAYGYIWCAE